MGEVALLVVLIGTVRPAFRGVRRSTVSSLASGARPPRRPRRLSRWAAQVGMPISAVLGLRSSWRRPSRLITNAAGLTFGVAMIVVALALADSLDLLGRSPPSRGTPRVTPPWACSTTRSARSCSAPRCCSSHSVDG